MTHIKDDRDMSNALASIARRGLSGVRKLMAGSLSHQSSRQLSSESPVWRLGRLNHVAVATPDLAKTSSFYRNVLGAKVGATLEFC